MSKLFVITTLLGAWTLMASTPETPRQPQTATRPFARGERPHREPAAPVPLAIHPPNTRVDRRPLEEVFQSVAQWAAPLRRCSRRGQRRFCDGARRVPLGRGDATERAKHHGLEGRDGWNAVMGGPAPTGLLSEAPLAKDSTLQWPVPEGFMGRGFGYTRAGRLRRTLHRGVDIPAAVGSRIVASQRGVVVYADNSVSGYGNMVVVLHSDDTRTLYAHLERSAVAAGEIVERGQTLGTVGRTGLSRAPHLHFELLRRARPRNPRRLFVGRPTYAQEQALMSHAAERRRAGREHLAELRAKRDQRRRRVRR